MKNNKGLSAVVTTLILILLALIAIGVVWAIVSGFLGDTEDKIDIQTEALTTNCVEQGGDICEDIETCPGTLFGALDGECCSEVCESAP